MQVKMSAQGKYSLSPSQVVELWLNVIFYLFKMDFTDFVSEKHQTKSQGISKELFFFFFNKTSPHTINTLE